MKAGNTPLRAGRVRGRGDYFSDAVGWLRGGGEEAGGPGSKRGPSRFNTGLSAAAEGVGNLFGSGVGKVAGNAASYISRWLGMGSYIKKNSLISAVPPPGLTGQCMGGPQGVAQFRGTGAVTFAHREFITNIYANNGADFTLSSYFLNPGNPLLCPWLSQIAPNFEEYEWLGLIFEYRSSSGNIVSSSPGMGLNIMATDYDVVDAPFANKQQMEIADFSASNPCYTNFDHPIECDPNQNVQKMMYVQPGITSAASCPDDPRFSSLGNFQFAVTGVPGTSAIGELWVSYNIRFCKPQLGTSLTVAQSVHAGFHYAANGILPLGTFVEQGMSTAWVNPGVAQYNCSQPGTYLVITNISTEALAASRVSLTTQSLLYGATYKSINQNPFASGSHSLDCHAVIADTVNDDSLSYMIINIVNPGDGFIITSSTNTAEITWVDVYITPYSSALTSQLKKKTWSIQDMVARLQKLESQADTDAAFKSLKCEQDDDGEYVSRTSARKRTTPIPGQVKISDDLPTSQSGSRKK